MKFSGAITVSVFAVILGCSVTSRASTQINFTGPNSYDGYYYDPSLGGYVYAGLYNATVSVNGGGAVSTPVICDDYLSEIYDGDSWQANTTPSSDVTPTSVKYQGSGNGTYNIKNPDLVYNGSSNCNLEELGYAKSCITSGLTQQQEYNMISYLAGLIFQDTDNKDGNWASMAGAIWSIADGGWGSITNGQTNWNCAYLGDCSGFLDNGGSHSAEYYVGQALAYANISDTFNVYTPTSYSGNCTGPGESNCDGQEFFAPAPEPGLSVLLIVTLLGCGLFGNRLLGARGAQNFPVPVKSDSR